MRNERIFGKKTPVEYEERPQNVCTRPSRTSEEPVKHGYSPSYVIQEIQRVACTHAKDRQSLRNPKKNTSHLPVGINERQIVQSRSGFVPVEFPARDVERDEVHCRKTTQRQISKVAPSQDQAFTRYESREIEQGKEGRQTTTKQQEKVGEDQMEPRSRSVATIDQATPQRRNACQHVQGTHGRRYGLCAQTDPAQQQLMFIRVVRKRF